LPQGKQSSTTPSPAGPAPTPRWRLDHGRLRLGRRRPWLGPLRLRSGQAQELLLRRPCRQTGQRPVGPAMRRRRASPVRLPGSPRLRLLLPPPHSLLLPLLLLSFSPRKAAQGGAWRLRDAPHPRRLPRARLRGGGPDLPHFLLSSCGGQGLLPHGAAARYREEDGRLLVGWRLGFGARERAAGIRFRGHAAASGGQRGGQRCREGWRPWGRRGSPPTPRPHGVRHGEDNREKRIRSDRLGPHVSGCGVWLVVSGLAGRVGPKSTAGCGLVNSREELGVL
jgi:hypothetical protein